MEPNLGDIKEYLREKGIELTINDKRYPVSDDMMGDPLTERYFSYYVEHSKEIENWRKERQKQKEANVK